jgi:hypothetical protein
MLCYYGRRRYCFGRLQQATIQQRTCNVYEFNKSAQFHHMLKVVHT